ncbi:sugar phosphate isomerase/epimerase [candidate division KSB1 bacterium]|nr:sugar phosphate isomerase/epimerase [candidate division KSB1 bacterium]
MKLSICNELFEHWELENVLAYCADLGYDGIEVAPFTLGEWPNQLPSKRREALRTFAENHKIDIVGLHWLLAGPPGLSISSPDLTIRQFTQKYLLDLIDLCADLGGQKIIFGSPQQRSYGAGQSYPEVWQYAQTLFTELASYAAERKVSICFEPLAPSETNFINTAQDALQLVHEVNHPNFRLHLDVKALCHESTPIPRIIQQTNGQLAHVHVNDAAGHEPGCGPLDFAPIIEALRGIGYQDYLSVEVFDFSAGAEVIASRAYGYLSRLL